MNRRYRKTIIAGNWKMNKTPAEAKALIEEMKPLLSKTKWCEMVLCVPFTDIQAAVKAAKGSKIAIGAENMHFEKSGASSATPSAVSTSTRPTRLAARRFRSLSRTVCARSCA